MSARIEVLDVVALAEPIEGKGLLRGQVGTVVEELGAGVFEVEFSDEDGRPYAFAALGEEKLIQLQYRPDAQPG